MRKLIALGVLMALLVGAVVFVPLPDAEGSVAVGLMVGHGLAMFPWIGLTVGDDSGGGNIYNDFMDPFMYGYPPRDWVIENFPAHPSPGGERDKGEEVNERLGDYVLIRKWNWGPLKWNDVPPITYHIAIARDSEGKYWLGVIVDWDVKGRAIDMARGFFCLGDDNCAKQYGWLIDKAVGDVVSKYQGKFAPMVPLPEPYSPPEEAWRRGAAIYVKQSGIYYLAGLTTTDQLWLPAVKDRDNVNWALSGVTWGEYWKKLRGMASDLGTARCIVNERIPIVVTAEYLGCGGNGWYKIGPSLEGIEIPRFGWPPHEFSGTHGHNGIPWPAFLMPYYFFDALTTDLFSWEESLQSYRHFWAMLPLLFKEDHIGMWSVKPGEFIGYNPGKNGYEKEAMDWPPTAFLHHHPECVPDYDTRVFDKYIGDWEWSAWRPRDAGDPFLSTQKECAIEFTKELWATLSSGIKDIWRTGPWKQGGRYRAYIPDATGAKAPVTATWPVIMSTFSADYPVASGFWRTIFDPQMASVETVWMQENYLKANYWQSGIDAVPFIDVKAGRSYLPLRVFALTYVPLYDPLQGSWKDQVEDGFKIGASSYSLPGDLWRVVKDSSGEVVDRQIILKGMLIPLAGDPLYPQVTARAWIKISLGTKTIKEVRKLHFIPPDNLFTSPMEKDWTVYVVPGKDVDIEVYVTVAAHIPYVEKRVIQKDGKTQIMYQPVDVLSCRLHDPWARCNKMNWKGGWTIPPVGLVVFHGHMHSPYDFIFWRDRIYVPSRLMEWLIPAAKVEWDGFYRIFRFKVFALNSIEGIVNAYRERSYRVDYAEPDIFKAAKADGPFNPIRSPVYYLSKEAWPTPDKVAWSPEDFLTKPRPVIRLPDYFKPGFEDQLGDMHYYATVD